MATTLDVISGGRLDIGLGSGSVEREHHEGGMPWGSFAERSERLGEVLEIVTQMFEHEVTTFSGKHFQVRDLPNLPRPVQSPRPPVIVGGAGAVRTPRLAARFADEFNVPFHTLERGAAQFQRVRAACEDQRRDVSTMTFSAAQTVVCGVDDAAVRRGLDAIRRDADGVGLCGTPAQLVDTIGQWADAGASRMYLQFLDLDDLDQLRLIGEEVLPRVA
jgi:alkanesulfonate monooxygenase SsuD/methylene tetrahydromethanopterin reductase-like flavin-dependent oxidoreductase (luciferase family)